MRNILWVIVILLVLAFASTSIAAAPDGEKIYKSKCALCHGAKGEGIKNMAPPHKGNQFVLKGSHEEIEKVIKEGRAGKAKKYKEYPVDMPKHSFSEPELDAVIRYIQVDLQK